MSKVIGPFRHVDVVGTIGPDGFEPSRPRPSGLVSSTAGYVRDAAGNRLRPMTPADLQAAADKHYGRTR